MPDAGRSRSTFLISTATLVLGAAVAGGLEYACPSYITESRVWKSQVEMEFLQYAIESYQTDKGRLPDELGQLVGEYMRLDATDPWGNPYAYRKSPAPRGYEVYSRGLNGVDEKGAGDDVVIREARKRYPCALYQEFCLSPCQVTKGVAFLSAGVSLLIIVFMAIFLGIKAVGRRAA